MPEKTDSKEIVKRLSKIRAIMDRENIDIYVVFTGDYHMSEYAGAYFSDREYLSGFTGSAGTLVITAGSAALFTDGRYFIQAEMQTGDTGIELMRMGCAGVPDLTEYVRSLFEGGLRTLGTDGRTCDAAKGEKFKNIAKEFNGKVSFDFAPTFEIWEDRPDFPDSKAYELEMCYCGESRKDKIERLRRRMKDEGVSYHVIASLDDICWLLNIRGADVECNPVVLSYVLVTMEEVFLYTNEERFTRELAEKLLCDGVKLKAYGQIYEDLESLNDTDILIDKKRVNIRLYESIGQSVRKYEKENPSVLMKAVKNETELANLRAIHIHDGLAVTRFMFWLKDKMKSYEEGKEWKLTECSAAEYLDGLRSKIPGFRDLSFDTISAANENAAMMHYHATPDNCAALYPEGMLLVDSGGQYLEGTTDVTRTFALGAVTDEMKKHFTLALKGMLQLTAAKFLKGCTGFNLDILARQPLWDEGIDYRCGTGHGIGYFLNVHESPNGFRWKHNPGVNDLCVLEEGMVTSNEPGVYIDGQYGIRIENEIVCVKDYENEYGTFLKFETLTLVPIDLELVDKSLLDSRDIERLNSYHKKVYDALSAYLSEDECERLREYTKAI